MQNITLTVVKADVYEEIAKTTSYVGAKKIGNDADSYERIFTTDEDRQMLERFWHEACNAVTTQMRDFLSDVSQLGDSFFTDINANYELELNMPDRFETKLTNSIEKELFTFFVCFILGQWYSMTNVEDAEGQAKKAEGVIKNVMDKIYYLTPPVL
ncbi:MAG: hypothetical protein IJ197_08765 [Bacteroidaceae bacterium]|nr:hypothetical protein [Bacteroidaceae bacterium]